MKRTLLLLITTLLCQLHLPVTAQGAGQEDDGMAYLRQQLLEAQDIGDKEAQSAVYQEMALMALMQHQDMDAVSCARMAVDIMESPSDEARLTLSLTLIQVDSLIEAKSLLRKILHSDAPSVKSVSTAYRYLLRIAIAEGRNEEALALADSVCQWDDCLFEASQQLNHAYSREIGRKDSDMARQEAERQNRSSLIAGIVIVCAILIIFAFYLVQMRRRINRFEQEMKEQKRQAQEQLMAERLQHHEDQIAAMRSFLDQKVDTIQRIEELKEGASQHFVMGEKDWQELEGFLDSVEDLFVKRLRRQFPDLNEEAIHLMMLLRLHMPTRSLAIVYGISEKSVKQKLFVYKEKVGLKGEKTSLRDFIQAF